MKPGMQRDLLVAFWFLFDEFQIGDEGALQADRIPDDSNRFEERKPIASTLRSRKRRTLRE